MLVTPWTLSKISGLNPARVQAGVTRYIALLLHLEELPGIPADLFPSGLGWWAKALGIGGGVCRCACTETCVSACAWMCVYATVCAGNLAWFSPWHPCLCSERSLWRGWGWGGQVAPPDPGILTYPHLTGHHSCVLEGAGESWLNHSTTIYFLSFRSFCANFSPNERKCSKDHPSWLGELDTSGIFKGLLLAFLSGGAGLMGWKLGGSFQWVLPISLLRGVPWGFICDHPENVKTLANLKLLVYPQFCRSVCSKHSPRLVGGLLAVEYNQYRAMHRKK